MTKNNLQKYLMLIAVLLLYSVVNAQNCDSRTWSGVAKYHTVTTAVTACGYSPIKGDTLYAALRATDYQSGRFCNTCLKVSKGIINRSVIFSL